MRALTPAERHGVLLVAGLFLLGAAYDMWRSAVPPAARPPRSAADTSWREPAGAGATAPGAAAGGAAPSAAPAPALPAAGGSLDLNRATASDLEALDGIGPKLALRIVEHRRAHGPFRSVEELRAVRGIGPRLMERVRPRVTVVPPGG